MKLKNALMLGGTALVAVSSSAFAADLPSRKAAPVEYVKVCDVYGRGFFYIPGTDTCLKVGGYVRVDYDVRGERERTGNTRTVSGNANVFTQAAGDRTTTGFYNRAAVELDARTQTAWGTVQTFMRLRMDTGSGLLKVDKTGASLESAYIRFAGFTFGQAAQPFSFLSSWAYNTHHVTGWPNGVRQIAYTHTFGGGLSATVAVTDMQNYSQVTSASADPKTLSENYAVFVANLRMDQSWGSAQIMAAGHNGGGTLINGNGYAIGAGIAFNLPMIAAGDRLELTAVYADRLGDLINGNSSLNTPSSGAYVSNPLGGPATKFEDATAWQVAAQFRHHWTPMLRSQIYASYVQKDLHNSTASGTGMTLGHALIWSPTRGFDIGLELNYLRSTWNQQAARVGYNNNAHVGGVKEDNWTGKMRIQRNF